MIRYYFKILFLLISLNECSNKLVTNPSKKEVIKSTGQEFWIDFRADYKSDTVSLTLNENILLQSKVISTGEDGSYFTGVRIIYTQSKKGNHFLIKNKTLRSNKNLFLADSLIFDLTINSQFYSIKKSLDSCKVFFISFDRNHKTPVIDKSYSFIVYE